MHDTEVEVGIEVGADYPFVHHTDGRSGPLAYVIYTMYKSCYLVDSVCLPSIIIKLTLANIMDGL